MSNSNHKFCVNCAHFSRLELGPFTPTVLEDCHHPVAPRNLVTGAWPHAAGQRLDVLECGPEGSRYQRKPMDRPQEPPNRAWREGGRSLRQVFANWFGLQ